MYVHRYVRVHTVLILFFLIFSLHMNMHRLVPRSSFLHAARVRLISSQSVEMPSGLITSTPVIESIPLSQAVGTKVMLKMENNQPSGSFKDRGMAYLCSQLKKSGVERLICSSGGNAGHAVAAMGRVLNMRVCVVVPTTTKRIMLDKIRAQGAVVTVHGANWNEADELARSLVAAEAGAEYIPP